MKKVNVTEWLESLPEEVLESVMAIEDPKTIEILVGLNPSQVKAVMALVGPIQINAVAGSGKTRVLVQRIAYMLANNIKPKNILVTTFTKKAAEEMTTRLKPLIPNMALLQMTIGTTHSIGWKILSKEYKDMNHHLARAFTSNSSKFLINGKLKIFADKVKQAIIKDRTVSFEVKEQIRDLPIPTLLKVVGSAKNEGKDHYDFLAENEGKSPKHEAYCEFYQRYEDAKRMECVVDADDLLFLLWKLFKENPVILDKYRALYKYLLVDEAQDNNGLQYELFQMLAYPENNLFIVGDDDQSMYGFRGARPDQFIYFNKSYRGTKQIALEDNYRSEPHILEVANSLIRNNTERLVKSLKPNKKGTGDAVTFQKYSSEGEEATSTISDIKLKIEQEGVAPKDITVLYRTNAQSRSLEDRLIIEGLPYVIHGGISFYERKEVKDLVAYMQLALDPSNDKAVDRVINVPSRYLGKVFKDRMKAYSGSHWDALHGNIRMESYMKRGADDFISLVTSLNNMIQSGTTPVELVEYMMEEFYAEYLRGEGEDEDEGSSRFENIETLKFALEQYETVQDFLDYIEKMSSKAKHSIDGVQLMTIHKSKGLEFKIAYVVGCSQGLLPHFKAVESASKGKPLAIEEERRLLYVAITRAELECHVSSAGSFNGKPAPTSMFVRELGLPINEGEVAEEQLMAEPEVDNLDELLIEAEFKRKVYDEIKREENSIRNDALGE
jgi:DNA helicase II / ATP-dependent DNA helicase PcrA